MNSKNDIIVILTLLNKKREEVTETLEHMKELALDMLKYYEDDTVLEHRLFDEFTKLSILTIFSTGYPNWNNKEEYHTHITVLEEALQHIIDKNITINIKGNLKCSDCDRELILQKLLTFDTIIKIHKFIVTNYPMLTHIISSQMVLPTAQTLYGLQQPINFTTFIMKGEHKEIIPEEQLREFGLIV